jgi:cytochrome c oxidase subunit 4
MMERLRQLMLTWILLILLLALEIGVSLLPLGRSARPLVLVPAVLMVAAVGMVFMEAGRGPEIVRLFAGASLLWLAILLGLGSLDPLTRAIYYVHPAAPNDALMSVAQ